MTRRLLSIATFVSILAAPAAQAQRDMPPGIEDLPIGLTPAEKALLSTLGAGHSPTGPPAGPVRAAPEWEESRGVFCLWDNADLMDVLQEGNDVYVISTNPNWWLNWLSSNGIPSTNFQFLNEPTNTWWVRDYGPWFVWDGLGEFGLVDNVYNRPRPLDDVIPLAISNTYGVPFYSMDLIHTGGNYYTDGYGTAYSSRLVYTENPTKAEAEVHQIMEDYLGVWRYATQDLDFDIEHFDTFGKPVAPDTLVWGTFPDNTVPWAYSEAALKRYQQLQSPYGWPYKIHRMPLWSFGNSWTAYVNSLQSNGRFIVPRYNTSHDAEAAAIFQAAAPGYRVSLANAKGTNWGDSIHCRTRNFVRGDTIRIYPQPCWEMTDETLQPYEVVAEVIPDNSTALSGTPTLYWTNDDGASWQAVAMQATGNPDEYAAGIPAHPWGSTIGYYIHAEDLAGRSKNFPIVAPAGLFSIEVGEDATPPLLDHDAIHGLTRSEWPAWVTAVATDETGIPELVLEYAIEGVAQPSVTMAREQGTFRFEGLMTGAVALGDVITYRIVATDGASPQNVISNPGAGWNHFLIEQENRVLVIELDESPDSGGLLVDVCDDLGLNVKYTTEWPGSLAGYETVMVCLGMHPTHTPLKTAQASALVSFLNAGGTAYVEGGNCWAQDSTSSMLRPYFGIATASGGNQISGDVLGVAGEFTEGMSFVYSGEARSSDHLTPDPAATGILEVASTTKAVTYDTGTYSSVAASFQAGSLVDGVEPSHAKLLIAETMDHLGLGIDFIVHPYAGDPTRVNVELEGDPTASYRLFLSTSPGYMPIPPFGILHLDRPTMRGLGSGKISASGETSVSFTLPPDLTTPGTEIFFQALVMDLDTGLWTLSNRDRIFVQAP